MPARCASICSIVDRHGSPSSMRSISSGNASPIVRSQESFPRSTRRASIVAVIDFVHEPRCQRSSTVTRSGDSELADAGRADDEQPIAGRGGGAERGKVVPGADLLEPRLERGRGREGFGTGGGGLGATRGAQQRKSRPRGERQRPASRPDGLVAGFAGAFWSAASAARTAARTRSMVSGVTEIDVIPHSTRNGGTSSGKSDGAWPQIPISSPRARNLLTASAIIVFTADDRASTGYA